MSQSSRSLSPIVLGVIAVTALGLALFVFHSRGAAEVREWTPADHDQPAAAAQSGTVRPRQGQKQPSSRDGGAAPQNAENLVELAWSRSCAACHGTTGRGDGPQA